ncbi:MAG TPA: alkaline phosphatase [Phycisphaerales bacterium]|nr:alkaline phosphatase [Phycisphaerales bacterium]
MPPINRRSFLRTSSTLAALGVGGAALGAGPTRATQAREQGPPATPPTARVAKNIIFMVSDGMSTGTLTLADLAYRQREGRPSHWVSLWSREGVRRGTATTYSADAWVTDSAAGGSAWGCGVHVNNGVINISNEGEQLVPILVHARQSGKRTGVVTTTRVTHATPASFVANVPKRDLWQPIAQQMLERGVDVMLGGGGKHFPDQLLKQHPGLLVARNKAELLTAGQGRLLGFFAQDHVPMVFERTPEVPALSTMTGVALKRLENPAGFVLQVEGGRVDHAAHNNDAASLIMEQIDFDFALQVVLHWMEGRDDTLLIVTTDHANANPGLTLYGKPGREAFQRINNVKHSFDWIWEELAKRPAEAQPAAVAEIVEAATGIGLDQDERTLLAMAVSKRRTAAFSQASVWTSVLGGLLADHLGVAFTGPNHTSDMVEVTAMGPGSELLTPALDNTDLHRLMVSAMQLPAPKLLPGMEHRIEPARGVNDD